MAKRRLHRQNTAWQLPWRVLWATVDATQSLSLIIAAVIGGIQVVCLQQQKPQQSRLSTCYYWAHRYLFMRISEDRQKSFRQSVKMTLLLSSCWQLCQSVSGNGICHSIPGMIADMLTRFGLDQPTIIPLIINIIQLFVGHIYANPTPAVTWFLHLSSRQLHGFRYGPSAVRYPISI